MAPILPEELASGAEEDPQEARAEVRAREQEPEVDGARALPTDEADYGYLEARANMEVLREVWDTTMFPTEWIGTRFAVEEVNYNGPPPSTREVDEAISEAMGRPPPRGPRPEGE